jgi:hypothetical protein
MWRRCALSLVVSGLLLTVTAPVQAQTAGQDYGNRICNQDYVTLGEALGLCVQAPEYGRPVLVTPATVAPPIDALAPAAPTQETILPEDMALAMGGVRLPWPEGGVLMGSWVVYNGRPAVEYSPRYDLASWDDYYALVSGDMIPDSSGGCRSRGSPSYRLRSGDCASWNDYYAVTYANLTPDSSGGCSSRGGPGYRRPSGDCASWDDYSSALRVATTASSGGYSSSGYSGGGYSGGTGGPVNVRGYTTSRGTTVGPYTRSAPTRGH